MGAGEQKIVRLVRVLEQIPDKSLVLLEEPEITLHPDAQRGLAWYLMTLSIRKGHQFIIATHSSDIFDTLPTVARVLLVRTGGVVDVLHNVPRLRAARELSRTFMSNKSLIIVEDEVARTFLEEMLRRYDRSLLENSAIVPVGNSDDVRRMVASLHGQGVNVVGVRDADMGPDANGRLLSLPGQSAPEALLLEDMNIRNAQQFIDGLTSAFDNAKAVGLGLTGSKKFKKIFAALPAELSVAPDYLTDRLTLAWLASHADEAKAVVHSIRECLEEIF